MPGFNKADYTASYNKSNYHSYTVRFNIKSENDIISRIAEEGGAKEYITRLIRADIKARKRKDPLQITGRGASGSRHDNIRMYPFEVLEALPGGGYRSLGYAGHMDESVTIILDYLEKGTPAGEILIAERSIVKKTGYGGWECRPGTVKAVRYGDAKK